MKKIALFFILVIVGIGCGKNGDKVSRGVIVTDSYGRDVVIESLPKRIVSLAPNMTEMIFEFGEGSRLVGRTNWCNYPAEAEKIENIGDIINPNFEKILSLKPDLVILSTHSKRETIDKLESVGIKCISLYGGESFDKIYQMTQDMGKILGKNREAEKKVKEMKNRVTELEKKINGVSKKRVYYMISFGRGGEYTAGGDTFISELIERAGGENCAKELKGWKYSLEKLMEKNPEIIICSMYNGAKESLKEKDGYKELSAVKNGKVYEIDNNKIDRQSGRVIDGLYDMAKIIHPELF